VPLCIVRLVKVFTKSPDVATGPFNGRLDRISRPMAGPDNAWSGYGTAWAITGTLLAGLAAWGGIGYLVDRLVDTYPLFTAIGLILGIAGAIYLVYLRYGREEPPDERDRG
jgi:F0F1-type ATP synthase assembly protein I